MLAFSVFIFRVVIKAQKKNIREKSVNFSNISVHVQRANSLEFLLPHLKLETLTAAGSLAVLTWQSKADSKHLQMHASDVSSLAGGSVCSQVFIQKPHSANGEKTTVGLKEILATEMKRTTLINSSFSNEHPQSPVLRQLTWSNVHQIVPDSFIKF